jgi:hypothetical protein
MRQWGNAGMRQWGNGKRGAGRMVQFAPFRFP